MRHIGRWRAQATVSDRRRRVTVAGGVRSRGRRRYRIVAAASRCLFGQPSRCRPFVHPFVRRRRRRDRIRRVSEFSADVRRKKKIK